MGGIRFALEIAEIRLPSALAIACGDKVVPLVDVLQRFLRGTSCGPHHVLPGSFTLSLTFNTRAGQHAKSPAPLSRNSALAGTQGGPLYYGPPEERCCAPFSPTVTSGCQRRFWSSVSFCSFAWSDQRFLFGCATEDLRITSRGSRRMCWGERPGFRISSRARFHAKRAEEGHLSGKSGGFGNPEAILTFVISAIYSRMRDLDCNLTGWRRGRDSTLLVLKLFVFNMFFAQKPRCHAFVMRKSLQKLFSYP